MRRRLRELLVERRLEELVALASERTRVLGDLVALTYDADSQIAWRAVEAMGLAAARIAATDPERVRDHLRRLLWTLREEAGAICWRAPEAMGEIVRVCAPAFSEYAPIVVHLLVDAADEDLEHFRSGMLWAIGRLGLFATAHLTDVLPAMIAALDHSDAQVRGMAVWALRRVGHVAPLTQRDELLVDPGIVELYEDGVLTRRTVAELLPHGE